jgi:hypothetical protein
MVGLLPDIVILLAFKRRLERSQLKGICRDTKSYALANDDRPAAPFPPA